MFHSFSHRPKFSLFGERRLCYEEGAKPSVNIDNKGGVGESIVAAGERIHDGVTSLLRTVFYPIRKPFQLLFESKKMSDEQLINMIRRTEAFLNQQPTLRAKAEALTVELDIKTVEALTDYSKWMAAFEATTLFTDDKVEPLKSGEFGPKELLLSIPKEDRAKLFSDFTNKLITKNTQELYREKLGAPNTVDPATTAQKLSVMKAVTGLEKKPDDVTYMIATQSLRDMYFMESVDPKTGLPNPATHNKRPQKQFIQDYQSLLREHQENKRHPSPISPDELKKDAKSSPFIGAMNLGVVGPVELQAVGKQVEADKQERDKARLNWASEYEKVTGLRKAEFQKESMDALDIWRDQHWAVKLGIIAGGIMLLRSHPELGSLGAAYALGSMFIFKKDPLKLAGSGGEYLRKKTGEWNKQIFGEAEQKVRKAQVLWDILPAADREVLLKEATSLALVSEMKMEDFIESGAIQSNKCRNGRIAVNLDVLGTKVKADADKKGMKSQNVLSYLKANQVGLEEGMSMIFYNIAKQNADPATVKLVSSVESAVAALPAGKSIRDLEKYNPTAAKDYQELIRLGVLAVEGNPGMMKMELGDIIQQIGMVTMPDYVNTVVSKEVKDIAFETKVTQVRGYMFDKKNAGLSARKDGPNVYIEKENPIGKKYSVSIPYEKFKKENLENIVNEWVRGALVQKETEFKNDSSPGSRKPSKMTLDGQWVLVTFDSTTPIPGRISIFDLVDKTAPELDAKYMTWAAKYKGKPKEDWKDDKILS